MHKVTLCRRSFIVSVPLLAAGCVSSERFAPILGGDYGTYGVIYDEGIVVPAVDTSTVDPNLLRQEVVWHGRERPGSILASVSVRTPKAPAAAAPSTRSAATVPSQSVGVKPEITSRVRRPTASR